MEILKRIMDEVSALAEQRVLIENTGFLQLWQLKNGLASISDWDIERISEFINHEKSLGYDENELVIEAWTSTHNEWYSYIAATVKNPVNGADYSFSRNVQFKSRSEMSKSHLEQAEAPVRDLIGKNREMYLGNKIQAAEFIEKGLFYQNNLSKMYFDQETHDYVLAVKKELEAEKAAKKEAARLSLLEWSEANGSDLLKLRIKHDQNWQSIAQKEWAVAHTNGFSLWEKIVKEDQDPEDNWPVNNATLEQLQLLEQSIKENPGVSIGLTRYKWNLEYDTVVFRTFLTCGVKTPTGTELLFQEIPDASEDSDQ